MKSPVALALLLLGAVALASCGGKPQSTARTVRIGLDATYPPFEMGRPPDYDGFEVDLMNEIASRLGLKTEYKDTPFDTIVI